MMATFKRTICFTLILLSVTASITLRAQTFITDTILYNGSSNKLINLVFMSEGYQSSELNTFITNVRNVSNYLLNTSPFLEYRDYFNVFAIRVPSLESGAKHPGTASDESFSGGQPILQVNTYFKSTFDYFYIHRLLVPQSSVANNVLLNNFPSYDQPIILVNSTYYGGSGGSTATSTLNTNSYEILTHEIGHSFANLADEYYAGDAYAAEKANMTQQTNPTLVKWKNWIGTNGIGIFQHCCGANSGLWFKPHQNCKMQVLNFPYCAVCKEQIIETIHQFIGSPVLNTQPSNQTPIPICSMSSKFSLSLLKPIPNTLRITWSLNGNLIASNIDSVLINAGQLTNGNNVLSAQVLDTTSLSRSSTHASLHTYSYNWAISNNQSVNILGADTNVIVVCSDETTDISSLYNTVNLTTKWDIPNPSIADIGHHFLIATNNTGCIDTAFIDVKQQVANWVGNISSDWFNPQNWLPPVVPSEKTHVIVRGSTTFPCIISTQSAVVASIQVKQGGNYSISNNKILDIKSNCSSLPTQ